MTAGSYLANCFHSRPVSPLLSNTYSLAHLILIPYHLAALFSFRIWPSSLLSAQRNHFSVHLCYPLCCTQAGLLAVPCKLCSSHSLELKKKLGLLSLSPFLQIICNICGFSSVNLKLFQNKMFFILKYIA